MAAESAGHVMVQDGEVLVVVHSAERLQEIDDNRARGGAAAAKEAMLQKSSIREFLAAQMLLSPFAPLQVLMVSLMIQARHLFYGISMLDKFKDMGWKKFYLIYGMCDETFSINCTAEIPEDCDRGWFYFFVTLLNQLYWVGGATLGGLLGNLITFDTKGLDFVMTAMFIVIFLEQWLKEKRHFSEWAGLASSAACLLIFGKDNFMIPAMICILLLLTAFRKPVGRKAGEEK